MVSYKLVRVSGTALAEMQEQVKKKNVGNPVGKTASTEGQEYTLDGSEWDGEAAEASSMCIATCSRDGLQMCGETEVVRLAPNVVAGNVSRAVQ